MRVLFICSSLEVGKDGVGDYCRRLATALEPKGISVLLIAWNDPFIHSSPRELYPDVANAPDNIRFPSGIDTAQKIDFTKKWLIVKTPDWISLQFVPYGFNNWGLPFKFIGELKSIRGGKKWHIMFHELWIGVDGRIRGKDYIIQALQKYIINRLIKTIKPLLITTSNNAYRLQLTHYDCKLLPLFSNIPFVSGAPVVSSHLERFIIVHFGSFTDYEGELKAQLLWLKSLAEKKRRQPFLKIMGGIGPFGQQSLRLITAVFGAENVEELGRLDENLLSWEFQQADFGISKADHLLCGKSGSTLAMIEHGLPVLLRGERPQHPTDVLLDYPNAIFFTSDKLPEKRHNEKNSATRLNTIANQFVEFLTAES